MLRSALDYNYWTWNIYGQRFPVEETLTAQSEALRLACATLKNKPQFCAYSDIVSMLTGVDLSKILVGQTQIYFGNMVKTVKSMGVSQVFWGRAWFPPKSTPMSML